MLSGNFWYFVLDDLRGSWIKAESAALAFNYKLNHGPTSSCVNSSTVIPITFKSFKVDLTAFWSQNVLNSSLFDVFCMFVYSFIYSYY